MTHVVTSTQPEVDPKLRFCHSAISKVLPTVRVKLKDGSGSEMTINEMDFDDEKYLRVD